MSQLSLPLLKEIFENELEKSLDHFSRPQGFFSKRLHESMTFALSSKGKRLRPLLVLSTAISNKGRLSNDRAIRMAMPCALAVEYLHTYSLVHDDLPAMDDDEFRRGRPSVHKRFDEALAILTGDALLSDAFFLAAKSRENASAICLELALTAGSSGLAAGQSEDLCAANTRANSLVWQNINRAKTARLFEACSVVGALSVNTRKRQILLVKEFGQVFGEAFQIKDDLDDSAGLHGSLSRAEMIALKNQKVLIALQMIGKFQNQDLLVQLIHLTFASLTSDSPKMADSI